MRILNNLRFPVLLLAAACGTTGDVSHIEAPEPILAPMPGKEDDYHPNVYKGKELKETLTVQEVVEEAIENNREILTARQEEAISKAESKLAYSFLLPKFNFRADYLRRSEVPAFSLTGQVFGPKQETSLTVTMDYPIYGFGRHINRWRAAKLNELRTGAQVRATEADIAALVTAAAYDYLETIRNVEVGLANEKAFAQQAEDSRTLFSAGKVTKSAVLEAEVEHSRRVRERERFESLVPVRRVQLNILIGRPASATTQVVDDPYQEEIVKALSELETDALLFRPEIKAATYELARAQKNVQVAIADELPEIRGFVDYFATDNDFTSPQDVGRFGFNLNWNFFESGAKTARIRRAKRERDIAGIQRDDTIANIRAEIVAIYRNVREAYKDIDVARKNIERSEESLEVQRQKYKVGRATSREVLDSTSLLTESRFEHVRAIYEYNIALQRLQRARGGNPRVSVSELVRRARAGEKVK